MKQLDDMTHLIVDADGHKIRVDQWIASEQPEFSRSFWTDKIKQGYVLVNAAPCQPKTKLICGDTVSLLPKCFDSPHQTENEAQDIPLDIIYEDAHVLVLNKPAGLVVHPGAGNKHHTLLNGLLFHNPQSSELPRAGIVHRLDKNTTGIMVVAKTLLAYNQLIKQLQAREIKREYQALVYGHLISGDVIETYYGRHTRNRLKMAVLRDGKEAITRYSIKQQFGYYTLLDVQLETGRTHQIRVHMAHIGHPIVGDSLYGQRLKLPPNHSDELEQILPGFKRQALHAYQLSFTHPKTNKALTFTATLPDDFKQLIEVIKMNYEQNQP